MDVLKSEDRISFLFYLMLAVCKQICRDPVNETETGAELWPGQRSSSLRSTQCIDCSSLLILRARPWTLKVTDQLQKRLGGYHDKKSKPEVSRGK